jgi:AcrR family transcriptional regulator
MPALADLFGTFSEMVQSTPKPARRSQAQRSATTSARLIGATIQCLFERGYAATSTSLVAERAGVSRGAMLHHFATKVDLMSSTVQETYANDIAAYTLTLSDISLHQDKVEKLIDTAWQCFKSPGGVAQTEIWMAARSDPELAAAVLPIHAAIARRSVRALTFVMGDYAHHDAVSMEALLCYLVSALRGLSIQRVLGSPESELMASVALIKSTARSLLVSQAPTSPALEANMA